MTHISYPIVSKPLLNFLVVLSDNVQASRAFPSQLIQVLNQQNQVVQNHTNCLLHLACHRPSLRAVYIRPEYCLQNGFNVTRVQHIWVLLPVQHRIEHL